MAGGKHGTGEVAESSYVVHKLQAKRETVPSLGFWNLNPQWVLSSMAIPPNPS